MARPCLTPSSPPEFVLQTRSHGLGLIWLISKKQTWAEVQRKALQFQSMLMSVPVHPSVQSKVVEGLEVPQGSREDAQTSSCLKEAGLSTPKGLVVGAALVSKRPRVRGRHLRTVGRRLGLGVVRFSPVPAQVLFLCSQLPRERTQINYF